MAIRSTSYSIRGNLDSEIKEICRQSQPESSEKRRRRNGKNKNLEDCT